MGIDIEQLELLLLIAAIVAMVVKRLRIPYTVGLVVTGCLLTVFPLLPHIALTRQLVFNVLLPPLVFEAGFYIHWGELRRDMAVVLLLATVGVAVAAGATAAGMHFLAGWAWPTAIVFGVLIAATDPVSVIAAFKDAKVGGRLRLLVEAESLFNDGTAAVGFVVALAAVQGHSMGWGGAAELLAGNTALALLCGGVVGGLAILGAGRSDDHLVELSFTTVAAYGSFGLAEHFHWSGVLAALTAGLIVGNVGRLGALSERGREAVDAFWEYAAFTANSLIFLLIGVGLRVEGLAVIERPVVVAIAVVLVARALTVYPLCALFSRSVHKVETRHQHVLFWGGLRGALALGLSLGLPANLPGRDDIRGVAFAVVTFSIVVQGLTFQPLLRWLGEMGVPENRGSGESRSLGID